MAPSLPFFFAPQHSLAGNGGDGRDTYFLVSWRRHVLPVRQLLRQPPLRQRGALRAWLYLRFAVRQLLPDLQERGMQCSVVTFVAHDLPICSTTT